jgi:putative ABC transport system substrate-binding protein
MIASTPAPWVLPAGAQASKARVFRIAYIGTSNNAETLSRIAALRDGLHSLGRRDGETIRIEIRLTGADFNRIRQEVTELIASEPDVIVSGVSTAIEQVLRTTRSIPVVFAGITDPVGQGFVTSLARPGGNATGFAAYEVSLGGKWVEILKSIAPALKRAAVLYQPDTAPYMVGIARSIASAGPGLDIEIRDMPVRGASELETALSEFGKQSDAGLIVPPSLFALAYSNQIVALAAKYRMPAIYAFRANVNSGGLISYGVDARDQFAKAAEYVDRILSGVKPDSLPVQGPTKFDLAINRKVAKSLGLEIPPKLFFTADEVVE